MINNKMSVIIFVLILLIILICSIVFWYTAYYKKKEDNIIDFSKVDITKYNDYKNVIFTTSFCGHCAIVMPIIKILQSDYPKYKIINIDSPPEVIKFGIKGVP